MKKMLFLSILLMLKASIVSFSQTAELVKDLNQFEGSSSNQFLDMYKMNNIAYFFANDEIHGYELWRSDGTEQGTYMLKDIIPGKGSSINFTSDQIYDKQSRQMAVLNNKIYFLASDGLIVSSSNVRKIWTSDGTAANTQLFPFQTAENYSFIYPSNLTTCNNLVYFSATTINTTTNTNLGNLPWRTDGTAAGTFPLIETNSSNDIPSDFKEVNGTVFFATNGNELWKTNGTKIGTTFIKNINPTLNSKLIGDFTSVNGVLFFTESNLSYLGGNLWRSDGTAAGTVQLMTSIPTFRANHLLSFNNQLYFSGFDGDDRSVVPNCNGSQLWKSDGTNAGTVLVKNIFTSMSTFNPNIVYGSDPAELIEYNNKLFFTARITPFRWGIYESDGTTANTVLVKALTDFQQYRPEFFNVCNGKVYFQFDDGINGKELWKSDGTDAGTSLVKDIRIGSPGGFDEGNGRFLSLSNSLLFFASDKFNNFKLWKTDGTANGTAVAKDIVSTNWGSQPAFFSTLNNQIYFQASSDSINQPSWGLWKTDGTAANTVLVSAGSAAQIIKVNNILFFARYSNDGYMKLFKSDGTESGTTVIDVIFPLTNTHLEVEEQLPFFNFNNTLLFFGKTDKYQTGYELWKSDGTLSGTVKVKDLNVGNYTGTNQPHFFQIDGIVYFVLNREPGDGNEIWRTDGTEEGTYLLKDIYSGSYDGLPSNPFFTNLNGTLYFLAANSGNDTNFQLWKTDGTEVGTINVTNTLNHAPNYKELVNVNGVLFLCDSFGNIWKSDGTAAGTILVKGGFTGNQYNYEYHLTNYNGTLFFVGTTSEFGRALWKSNGTEIGTVMVKDITVGNGSVFDYYNIKDFYVHNNKLYFSANDYISGNELWETDGTEAGTKKYNINDLDNDSDPHSFFTLGNTMFFSAISPKGRELWKLVPNSCPNILPISSPNYTNETITRQASATSGLISATNQVTNTAKITYQSKAILLNVGFKAQPSSGGYFKAEFGGCN